MTAKIEWPRRWFAQIPELGKAKGLADLVYQLCELDELNVDDSFDRVYEIGGFSVKYPEFGRYEGEGILCPEENNKFKILINTLYTDKKRQNDTILHEIGHSFFYYRGNNKPRRLPRKNSEEEERFCDEFANSLLKLLYKDKK